MTSQNEAIPGPLPEVPVDLDELTPSRVLLLRYMIESQLTAPGSMSGHQADRLRSGLGGAPQDGGRVNGQEALHAKLGDLLLLCRDLNRVEERVCRLRYGATAGSVTYEALRRVGDLREGDGEDIVDLRPRDIEGRSVGAEWVRVRGRRSRLPSHHEIAQLLADQGVCSADGGPMTSGAVERRLRDASAKIATAIRARAWPCSSGKNELRARLRPEEKAARR